MRNSLLILFVLICTAVISIDRYLTTDSVRLCMDGNAYNIREQSRIIIVHNQQAEIAQLRAAVWKLIWIKMTLEDYIRAHGLTLPSGMEPTPPITPPPSDDRST